MNVIERTLQIAQEMKMAMGGRTSDPVNPNFLTAAAAIAIEEARTEATPLRADQCFVAPDLNEDGPALATEELLLEKYRDGYGDAFRWVLSNIDLDVLDRDRLEKALDSGPQS